MKSDTINLSLTSLGSTGPRSCLKSGNSRHIQVCATGNAVSAGGAPVIAASCRPRWDLQQGNLQLEPESPADTGLVSGRRARHPTAVTVSSVGMIKRATTLSRREAQISTARGKFIPFLTVHSIKNMNCYRIECTPFSLHKYTILSNRRFNPMPL